MDHIEWKRTIEDNRIINGASCAFQKKGCRKKQRIKFKTLGQAKFQPRLSKRKS